MDHEYRDPHHHEDQNAVTEVGVPEPHQPGCRPPRADAGRFFPQAAFSKTESPSGAP